MTIEALKGLSHWLMVAAISLPIAGGLAGAARYLVQRRVDKLTEERRRVETGVLQDELVTARGKVQQLETRAAPRTLSGLQHQSLVANLRKHPGQIVFKILIGNTEAQTYALLLERAFTEAGWTVTSERAMFSPAFGGIQVALRSAQVPANHPAAIVLASLRKAGIELSEPPVTIDSVPAEAVWLKISSKE